MNTFQYRCCRLFLLFLPALSADDQAASFNHNEMPSMCTRYAGHSSSFPVGGDAALAFDFFRSLPDGSWTGNSGAFVSLNLAVGIPKAKYGFGAQIGGSYGLYDWDGRGSNVSYDTYATDDDKGSNNTKALQQQGFLTLGLFRMTPQCSGFNAGVVYDFMFNREFGVFAVQPDIAQLRSQFGYLFKGGNEIGVWGTFDTHTSHQEADEIPLKFRAICQANLFWSHYFKNTAQMMVWAGTPYRRGLMYAHGRAGRYILGLSFRAPLTKALSMVGHGSYMGAQNSPSSTEFRNYAANVCFGINYSFGGCKAGERPYLPLADNSNFLVDTDLNQ